MLTTNIPSSRKTALATFHFTTWRKYQSLHCAEATWWSKNDNRKRDEIIMKWILCISETQAHLLIILFKSVLIFISHNKSWFQFSWLNSLRQVVVREENRARQKWAYKTIFPIIFDNFWTLLRFQRAVIPLHSSRDFKSTTVSLSNGRNKVYEEVTQSLKLEYTQSQLSICRGSLELMSWYARRSSMREKI